MTTSAPKAPTELSTRSKALWRQVLATFQLEPADCELLRCALVALDRADEAAKSIAKLGVVVDDRYGTPKSNPAVDIELRNRALVARIFGQLGIKSQAEERWNPTRAKARRAANARWHH